MEHSLFCWHQAFEFKDMTSLTTYAGFIYQKKKKKNDGFDLNLEDFALIKTF